MRKISQKIAPISKRGFTLIELLVVIAIIGLLSTLAVVSLNNARAKARDARRMSDMKALQSAVELHIADYEHAPAVPGTWAGLASGAQADGKLTAYLPAGMPIDPSGTTSRRYVYCRDTTTTTKYLLAASLETTDAVAGDLDSTATEITVTYTLNSECIASDNAVPSALDCRDGANGNVDGVSGTSAFCLGGL